MQPLSTDASVPAITFGELTDRVPQHGLGRARRMFRLLAGERTESGNIKISSRIDRLTGVTSAAPSSSAT